MNILVAIANYGTKNSGFLKTVIEEYRSMTHRVDIVVLSDRPRDLGSGIEVAVGLPAKDPWSLPFGHKKIFADRLEDYDLFIYSEDDILITQNNIEFYLRLTRMLPDDRISGFLRYERDTRGKNWYPDFLGPFHWLPASVRKAGPYTVAQFSNLHSACYVLTRDQLREAIRSGGYLVGPHQGRYDLLCAAATDPYTQCGMKKVVCISHPSDMLVRHLPDTYAGRIGIAEEDFDRQIAFMRSREYSERPRRELVAVTKRIDAVRWDKVYFDRHDDALLALVPRRARNILSVGCGYPATEAVLARDQRAVTVIPLDPIVGTLAADRGMAVMESSFEKAFSDLSGTSFDCVLVSDLLQHAEDPAAVLTRAAGLLAPGGELIVSIPNFRYLRFLKDEFPYPVLRKWSYAKHLLHCIDRSTLTTWLRSSGIGEIDVRFVVESPRLRKMRTSFGIFNVLLASRLLARGTKNGRGPLAPPEGERP